MTLHYLDSSAWTKRHFAEVGSDSVRALFRSRIPIACCRIGLIELFATVARRSHEVHAVGGSVQTMLTDVREDFALFDVVEVDDALISTASSLAIRHRLRALDALHLASALTVAVVNLVIVVSSDRELLAASALEGMGTLDPTAS